MSQIMQIVRNLRLLQPQQFNCQIMMKYSDRIREAGNAKENVHFLKMQREQLMELRQKILRERELIKERIQELDEQIKSIKKKNSERKNKKESRKNSSSDNDEN